MWHKLGKAAITDQSGEIRAQMQRHVVSIIIDEFDEFAVVAAVKANDDSHDLAQARPRLPSAMKLATLEQALVIDQFKSLAKA